MTEHTGGHRGRAGYMRGLRRFIKKEGVALANEAPRRKSEAEGREFLRRVQNRRGLIEGYKRFMDDDGDFATTSGVFVDSAAKPVPSALSSSELALLRRPSVQPRVNRGGDSLSSRHEPGPILRT